MKDAFRLKRPRNPMPEAIDKALREQGLLQAIRMRPPYQQNDCLGWILRVKRPETQRTRLVQMLGEPRAGDTYMKMLCHAKS